MDDECLLLLSDAPNELAITGKMQSDSKHNRLSVVGIETTDGTQIEIHAGFVKINGIIINFDQDRVVKESDVTVQIFSHFKSKRQGVSVFTEFGPIFHVSGKNTKDSLKFEIESSTGLSKAGFKNSIPYSKISLFD